MSSSPKAFKNSKHILSSVTATHIVQVSVMEGTLCFEIVLKLSSLMPKQSELKTFILVYIFRLLSQTTYKSISTLNALLPHFQL